MKYTLTLAVAALLSLGAGSALAQTKICIDPGHGGSDPGAVGNGQQEAANCLDTSNRFKAWMDLDTADTAGGTSFSVYRTRTSDTTVELSARTSYANTNGVARFMSIHNNAFSTSSANGIETFCATNGSSTSVDLRNKVYDEATLMWSALTKRGTKTANYYVLVNTSMPAELHEMAFITNATDASYLGSATQRDNHAKSELFAIQRNLGFAKYTPQSGWSGVTDNTSAGSTPGTGWWTSTSTAGYYGSNYHTRGTAALSDPFTWTIALPTTASYKVEAWWTAGANRSATAPYIVTHSGGNTTVNVNQQANGAKWNSLGNFSFPAGTATVKLSCWTTAGYYVIADAIRFTRI